MTISDQTGRSWVTAFNDIAEPLLNGRTADELNELKEEGQVSLIRVLRQGIPFARKVPILSMWCVTSSDVAVISLFSSLFLAPGTPW